MAMQRLFRQHFQVVAPVLFLVLAGVYQYRIEIVGEFNDAGRTGYAAGGATRPLAFIAVNHGPSVSIGIERSSSRPRRTTFLGSAGSNREVECLASRCFAQRLVERICRNHRLKHQAPHRCTTMEDRCFGNLRKRIWFRDAIS